MSVFFWFPLDRARGTVIGFGAANPSTYQVNVGGTMTTVGIDKPAGSLFVQVADDGSSATLWLKSGSAATAWTTFGGGAFVAKSGDTMTGALTLPNCFIGGDSGVNAQLNNDVAHQLHLTFAGGTGTFLVTGGITASGEIQSTSDRRAKTHVRPITGALDLVRRLRGVRFAWRESGRESVGVIAQEVARVLPEIVDQPRTRGAMRAVAYGNLVAVLIEAVKELATRVERLEAERAR